MNEKDLSVDAETQMMGHTNAIRFKKKLPKIESEKALLKKEEPAVKDFAELDPVSKSFDEGDELGIENGELIVGIRLFDRGADGLPIGKHVTGAEGTAAHSRVRRERHHYYEVDGSKVEVGKVIRMRKGNPKKVKNDDDDEALSEPQSSRDYDEEVDPDGDVHEPRKTRKEKYEDTRTNLERKAPGVLRTIMVRLVPHEAEIAGRWKMSKDALAKAMDQTARIFAEAVGCDVISAVVHRMREKDLHIHLQYTMIIPQLESPSALGRRRLGKWKLLAAELTHAALAAEGRAGAGPRIVGKKTLELIANGQLPPEPVREMEYRKQKGKRSLGEEHLLGYSLRQKLNLVRLAEDANMPELAMQVTERRDRKNKFQRLAQRRDQNIEDHYMDVWLERTWRNAVKENLPEEAVKEMAAAGVQAAKDYVTYGTVMVEETHLDRRKDELDTLQAELNVKSEGLEKDYRMLLAGIEKDRLKIADELALAESARGRAEEAAAPIVALAKQEAAVIAKNAELQGLLRVLGKLDPGGKSKADSVEEAKKKLESGILKVRDEAEIGAWNRVLVFLGKKVVLEGATPESLSQQADGAIAGRIGKMASGLFRILGRKLQAGNRTTNEIENDLVEAGEAFKAEALRDGLVLAVSKIRGVEVAEISGSDDSELAAEIEMNASKFKQGVIGQTRVALEGLTHFVFGSRLGKWLIGKGKTEEELKSVLKDEFVRRGDAELVLEKALPILVRNDQELAETARKIIGGRPQLPGDKSKKKNPDVDEGGL